MSFLPKGEQIPEAKGNYLKLKEGVIKFRIVSDAITGFEYWTTVKDEKGKDKKKPIRLHESPNPVPSEAEGEIKYFWAFKVIDRSDALVRIFEITQKGVMRQMEKLINDPDWNEPKDYDITITGSGEGLDRRYTVLPSPHKSLTAEELSAVERTEIDLNALFEGKEPFIAEVEEEKEVKLEDVPF